MMHYPVAATAPDKRRVFQILHKFAIDQHVDEIDYLHLCGVEFIELVAGPHPDIFPRALRVDALYQCRISGTFLRMQRIAADSGS